MPEPFDPVALSRNVRWDEQGRPVEMLTRERVAENFERNTKTYQELQRQAQTDYNQHQAYLEKEKQRLLENQQKIERDAAREREAREAATNEFRKKHHRPANSRNNPFTRTHPITGEPMVEGRAPKIPRPAQPIPSLPPNTQPVNRIPRPSMPRLPRGSGTLATAIPDIVTGLPEAIDKAKALPGKAKDFADAMQHGEGMDGYRRRRRDRARRGEPLSPDEEPGEVNDPFLPPGEGDGYEDPRRKRPRGKRDKNAPPEPGDERPPKPGDGDGNPDNDPIDYDPNPQVKDRNTFILKFYSPNNGQAYETEVMSFTVLPIIDSLGNKVFGIIFTYWDSLSNSAVTFGTPESLTGVAPDTIETEPIPGEAPVPPFDPTPKPPFDPEDEKPHLLWDPNEFPERGDQGDRSPAPAPAPRPTPKPSPRPEQNPKPPPQPKPPPSPTPKPNDKPNPLNTPAPAPTPRPDPKPSPPRAPHPNDLDPEGKPKPPQQSNTPTPGGGSGSSPNPGNNPTNAPRLDYPKNQPKPDKKNTEKEKVPPFQESPFPSIPVVPIMPAKPTNPAPGPGGGGGGPGGGSNTGSPCKSPCNQKLSRDLDNSNKKLDRLLQGADAASNAAILAQLNTINNKLGAQVPGGISGFLDKFKEAFDKFAKWSHLDRLLNIWIFIITLHNAYMLSNALTQTLFSAISNGLAVIGIKDAEGSPLNVGEIIGHEFEYFAKGVLGTQQVDGIKAEWKKFNRIYQAAANIIWSVQSIGHSIISILEILGSMLGKIGNGLKAAGTVFERAFNWFNPQPNFQNRFFTAINQAEDVVSQIDAVAAETLSAQETFSNLGKQKEDLDKALAMKDDPSTKTSITNVEAEAEKMYQAALKKKDDVTKLPNIQPSDQNKPGL